MTYSSQGSHTGQLDFGNWLADGSTTGYCDKHYAPPSLIMSTFLIRSATSQPSSYPIVLTRLSGPRSRPNPHLKIVEVPGIEPATSWSVWTKVIEKGKHTLELFSITEKFQCRGRNCTQDLFISRHWCLPPRQETWYISVLLP